MVKNMKQLLGIALTLLALHATAFAQAPGGRIVTVDLNRLFTEYYKTPIDSQKLKETAEQFNKEYEEYRTQFRKLVDELNKLRDDQDKTEYTATVREQKQKALQEKLAQTKTMQGTIEEYQTSHRRLLDEQTQKMRQKILKEVKDIVLKESRDAGYGLVFDKSGNSLNQEPVLLYSQDSYDITEDILKILNKNKPADAPKAEEKGADKPAEKK